MKRRILAALLAVCLMLVLSSAAFAEDETFNAYLDVTQNPDGSISVTIPDGNEAVLASEKPTLSIPCTMTSPVVTKDGVTIPSTDEGEIISFVVETPGTYVISEAPSATVTLWGLSLVFDDIPRLRYYCDVPDSLLSDADAYLAFFDTEGNEISRTLLSTGTSGVYSSNPCTLYHFTVVPKKAETIVRIRFFAGNGTAVPLFTGSGADYSEQGYPFSMNEYAERMKVYSSNPKMRALAAALDDYCAAAVTYFGVGNSPVSSALADVTAETMSAYASVKTGTLPVGLQNPQISVVFDQDNSIRIYFACEQNSGKTPLDYTYMIDGNPANLLTAGNKYYLTVTGIAARYLGTAHTFSVSDGTDTYSLKASTLTYARLLLGSSKEASQNLGRALYLYAKAAEAYFTN